MFHPWPWLSHSLVLSLPHSTSCPASGYWTWGGTPHELWVAFFSLCEFSLSPHLASLLYQWAIFWTSGLRYLLPRFFFFPPISITPQDLLYSWEVFDFGRVLSTLLKICICMQNPKVFIEKGTVAQRIAYFDDLGLIFQCKDWDTENIKHTDPYVFQNVNLISQYYRKEKKITLWSLQSNNYSL